MVYLVTFSHSEAEGRRHPSEFSRQEFADLLVKAFEVSVCGLRVEYLAIFQEKHTAGPCDAARNPHFHASVKSDIQYRSVY